MKSNPGSRFRKSYIGKRDANGNLDLHCTGRVDQYAMIQADKESTDINVILSRFAEGDSTALSRMQAIYADYTGLPDSYIGMINMIEEGKRAFDELPAAMKQVFDNDFVKMLSFFDNAPYLENGSGEAAVSETVEPVTVSEGGEVNES